ncbi:MAG: PQQ-binding-like beta-propeller repeat protein [Pirellulaceae bacterium]|nr:PQQ-binding-like beta-propeller repeat protein [Pirellulaceae bacterium]
MFGRQFLVVLAASGLVLSGLVRGQEPSDSPADPAADVAADSSIELLVDQLGDPAFAIREAAAARLAELGEQATPGLLAALQLEDPEIQRRARRILADVLQSEHARRLADFIADSEGRHDHQLPGWDRFRTLVGDDPPARQLFIEMQQAEPALLASADAGADPAAEALELRLGEVMAQSRSSGGKVSSLGSLAALLFVSADPELNLPLEVLNSNELMSITQPELLKDTVTNSPLSEPLRRLLGRWVLRPSGVRLLQGKLRVALEFDLPEGLELGVRTLAQKELPPNYRFFGVQALAKLGGVKYAARLLPLLEDKGECTRRVIRREGNIELISIQIRDVTLGWLIHLTGQDHAEYHLEHAKSVFERLAQMNNVNLSIISIYFAEEAHRDQALDRWRQYVQEHPLPEPPPLPGSSAEPALLAGSLVPDTFGVMRVPGAKGEEAEPAVPPGQAPAERALVRQLDEARERMSQGSFGEAAQLLGGLVADDQEALYQPERLRPIWRGLRSEAERMLGELPAAGLESYELQFGPEARELLDAALAARDAQGLERVGRAYLHTQAGREATYLLGSDYFDRGQPLRAALCLERVWRQAGHRADFEPSLSLKLAASWLQAGQPQRCQEVLVLLRAQRGTGTLDLGGGRLDLFEQPERAVGWLEALLGRELVRDGFHWDLPGGNPARNRPEQDLQPLLRGEPLVRQVIHPELVKQVTAMERAQLERYESRMPSGQPLVTGNRIVVRTATHLLALDRDTGRTLWQSPLDDSLAHWIATGGKPPSGTSGEEFVSAGLQRRLWDNGTFGWLSSNGSLVFAVEGLAFGRRGQYQRLVVMPDGRRRLDADGTKPYSTLAAYDLETGKVVWEVGGPQSRSPRPLSGTLFLGPPLPLGNRLYVIARQQATTHLLELDASRGDLVWQMALEPMPEDVLPMTIHPVSAPLDEFPVLRAGLSASFAGGVLVCPTATGEHVAVDLALRRVAWRFESPQRETPVPPGLVMVNALQRQMFDTSFQDAEQRWADPWISIAGGRVLLTPVGSDELYCLDLASGEVRWQASRGDGLYVAGVSVDDVVLVVGRGSVRGLRLADGKAAWNEPVVPLPAGSLPCGRGYLGQRNYYLPLNTGEVAVIDALDGRLVSRSRSPSGIVPGNLVLCDDAVLSLSPSGLWKFPRLEQRARELAERLAASPRDAEALTQRGELRLNQGRRAEAVADLREALRLADLETTRALFIEAALEGIRLDFAAHRKLAVEVRPLLKTDQERLRYLKLLAHAHQQAGELADALEQYLQLVRLIGERGELEFVAAGHRVRNDRWLRTRLTELFLAADAGQYPLLESRVRAIQAELPAARFLQFFGRLPLASSVRLELADREVSERNWLPAEQLLREVALSGPDELRPRALAKLADVLRQADRPQEALRVYARLQSQWPDAECLPGVTGRGVLNQLSEDDPVRKLAAGGNQWPRGNVEVKTSGGSARLTANVPVTTLAADGLSPRIQVALQPQGQALSASDAWGDSPWQITLGKPGNNVAAMPNMYSLAQGDLRGHLLVAWLGNRVVGVNLLAGKEGLLWSQDAFTRQPSQPRIMQIAAVRMLAQRGGPVSPGSEARPLVVTSDAVCFVQDNLLVAVDPLDGTLLWSREGFSDGCDLVTDGERLLVTPPRQSEARVLNVLDGRELTAVAVPDRQQRLTVRGHQMLVWDTEPAQCRVRLVDPLAGRDVWEVKFAEKSQPAVVGGEELLVVEPNGRLVLLEIAGGQQAWETSVPGLTAVDELIARRSDDQYLLIINTPPQADQPPAGRVVAFRAGAGIVEVSGLVAGVQRDSGKLLWSREIRDQSVDLNQPEEVPVLAFVNQVRTVAADTARAESRLLCLDSRSGQTLHEKSTEGYNNALEMRIRREQRLVEIVSRQATVTLQFTARPPD